MVISVVLAGLGYLAVSLWGGIDEVLAALGKIGPLEMIILLILSLVNYLLRFVRWQHYLGKLGHGIPTGESLSIYIGGFALTTTPGKVGEAVRSLFLDRYGVKYTESFAALFSERLIDLITILLLTTVGLYSYPEAHGVVMILAAILLFGLIFIQQRHWLKALDNALRQRFHGRLASLMAGMIETILHSGRLFSLPVMSYGLVLGVIAWAAEGVAFYYLVTIMGFEIDLGIAIFIYAFSMLVGAISFLPGGLGGAEVTMVALLILNGMVESTAVAATVVIRLTTLWFAVLLGIVALMLLNRAQRQD